MADIEHDQYDKLSSMYDDIEQMPMSSCYQEMIETGLGDCTDKTVLDLGGGTGFHARKAVDRGASFVDVLDVSDGMLNAGKAIKDSRSDRLRWVLGDMATPLTNLPLEKEYDIVMVNWTFDHAESDEVLETMWKNTADFTKPGGKLISIRMASCLNEGTAGGRYGVDFSDQKRIPGGWRYVYNARTNPPLSCPATTMDASMDFDKAKAMAERYGFVDFKKILAEDMKAVQNNLEFWKPYLSHPYFITIEATKAS